MQPNGSVIIILLPIGVPGRELKLPSRATIFNISLIRLKITLIA
jgi:hypothetical protein